METVSVGRNTEVGTAALGRTVERTSTASGNARPPHPSWFSKVGNSSSSFLKELSFRAQRGTCFYSVLLLALLLITLPACHSKSSQSAGKRYPFKGRVVAIDSQNQSAIIDGEAIPGFMDAMAMAYNVKPPSMLSQLKPGDSITAEVVLIEPEYWLENIKVISHSSAPPTPTSSLHMPTPGEDVPDFHFTNQNDHRISLKQYRGQVLLVTFIYTRCPFPDFCPRMTSNFAEIYTQIGTNPGLAATHLLSISFDPEHDTPKVLRDYASRVTPAHDASLFNRWEFAVPSATDLPKIADFFALTVKPDGGLITHNLSTAVIGPDGKIVSWYHGSDWQVSDLIKDATGATAHKG